MSEQSIICPRCNNKFLVPETVKNELEEKIISELQIIIENLEKKHQGEIDIIDRKIREKEKQIIIENLRKQIQKIEHRK